MIGMIEERCVYSYPPTLVTEVDLLGIPSVAPLPERDRLFFQHLAVPQVLHARRPPTLLRIDPPAKGALLGHLCGDNVQAVNNLTSP